MVHGYVFLCCRFSFKKLSEVFIRNNILFNYDFESAFLHHDLFILIVKIDFLLQIVGNKAKRRISKRR